ncbi:MAG: LamG-like jellyroll fold domain-containing protein [Bacteroidota bacterium]
MKKLALIFMTGCLALVYSNSLSQVIDPNDPIVIYNELNPPEKPAWGTMSKWVITPVVNWNTDDWKAYYYKDVPFRLRFPKNYDPNRAEKYPMIIILHGRGFSNGTIYMNDRHLNNAGAPAFEDAVDDGDFDGFILSPQGTTGYFGDVHFDILEEIIDLAKNDVNLDIDRISVNGRSAGAQATWRFINFKPRLFAAALPMSGASHTFIENVEEYKYTPIWLFQGELDGNPTPYTSENLIANIEATGGVVRYTKYLNAGHGIFNKGYAEPDFFPYMDRAHRANPHVLFKRFEFCPGDPVEVTLGLTPGYEAYQWSKDGVVIDGATSNEFYTTEFGSYAARFQRNGEWSAWSPAPVNVGIKEATQTPPIALSGSVSRVLPTPNGDNFVNLELPQGFVEYTWIRSSDNAVVGNERTFTATAPGEYVATVTEEFGCSSNFSAPFKVINANGPTQPSAPINPLAFAPSKTEMELRWSDDPSPSFNETGYEVYRSDVAGGPYQLLGITAADATSYLDQGLEADSEYFYILRAINENGASASTAEFAGTTQVDEEAPSVPLNVRVVVSTPSSITLEWDASTDDVGVYKYDIYRNGNKAVVTSETSATVFNLDHYGAYNFTVVARDLTGNESPHSSQLTAPAIADGLTYKYYEGEWEVLPDFNALTPIKTGRANTVALGPQERSDYFAFFWSGHINIPVAGNYTFETRSGDGSKLYIGGYDEANLVVNNDGIHGTRYRNGTYNFPEPGLYPIVVTFFEATDSEYMRIYWRNTAHGVGNRQQIPASAFTEDYEITGAVPNPPTDVNAVAAGFDQINITWNDDSDNETSFQILRSTSKEGPYLPIDIAAANATSYEDKGLQAETTYFYRITALGEFGSSSSSANADPLVIFSFDNDFTDATSNGVTVSAVGNPEFTDAITAEGTHAIYFNGDDQYLDIDRGNQFIHSAFTQRSVVFWMYAEDSIGIHDIFDEGGSTNGMGIRTVGTDLEVATQNSHVIDLIAAPVSFNQWVHVAAVFDNGTLKLYIDGQLVASKDDISYTTVNSHSNGGALGWTNSSNAFDVRSDHFKGAIDDFQAYDVALSLADVNGIMNAASNKPFATTSPLPPAPAAPAWIEAIATSTSGINLKWLDSSDNEDYFEVYRSSVTNTNYQLIDTVSTSGADTLSLSDEGLLTNVTYFYQVVANNAGGEGTSVEVSSKTLNNTPEITSISDFTVRFGTTYDLQLFAEDIDGETLTYSADNLPAFATLTDYGDGSALVAFAPAEADTGVYNLVIKVEDQNAGIDSVYAELTVNSNYPPELNAISDVAVDENTTSIVEITAVDQDGTESLVWSTTGLPSFATLTPRLDGTATLSVTPDYTDAGAYPVQVQVEDQEGATSEQSFVITVNDVNPNLEVYVSMKEIADADSPWNNVSTTATNNLLDSEGNGSGINMEFQTSWFRAYRDGAVTGNDSGVYPDAVIQDYYFFGFFGGPNEVTLKVSGLDTTKFYNFSLFASSKWGQVADNGHTIFTIDNTSIPLHVQNNSTNTADFTGIKPDANGEVFIDMGKDVDATVGYFNAMVIKSLHDYGNAPAAPRDLVTALNEDAAVVLTWVDAPFNETGFNVYRSDSENGEYVQLNTEPIPANATSYTDIQVIDGATYFYKVSAANEFGQSAYSNTASAAVPNRAPTINITGDTDLFVNQTSVLSIEAQDPPLNDITLSVSGLPGFANFTDNGDGTGTIESTPTAADQGTYPIEIHATDNLGAMATEQVDLTVSEAVLYTVAVNFGKVQDAPAPWNNTAKDPVINDVHSNLLDNNGVATNISLELTTAFGGFFAQGAQTGNDSGVVPDQVLKEYYWFGIFGAPNQTQLKVSGLDITKQYNFKFVGSSTFTGSGISDNGETIYSIGNQSVAVDVQANTSEAGTIGGVIANANGDVFIDISKGPTASVGYINALIIEAVEADPSTFNPSGLTATGVSEDAIQLNWNDNAFDEQQYYIYRSLTANDVDFALIDSVGQDVSQYTDSGLSNGAVYYYKVRGQLSDGLTDYTNTASGGTIAFSVYININGNPTYDAPTPWNNLSKDGFDGDHFIGFRNQSGQETGMSMYVEKAMQGSNAWGATTGDDSGVYPDLVMQSFFFTDAFEPASFFRMRGLEQGYNYNFTFFGSIVTGFNIQTNFSIGDQTVTNSQTDNISQTVSINGIQPDQNNEVLIKVQEAPGSNWAIFNAMVINAYPVDAQSNIEAGFAARTAESPQGNLIEVRQGIASHQLTVYPNPADDVLNLRVEDSSRGNMEVKVVDMMGKLLYSNQFENEGINHQAAIDLRAIGLQKGIYLIETTFSDGQKKTSRFIVN